MEGFAGEAWRILVALLIGLLIGLDRERAESRKKHRSFAGVRTFPLIALAGCVPMLIDGWVGLLLATAGFLAVSSIAVISYLRASAAGDIGATTEVAAVGTYLLGVLAGQGNLLVAGAAGVAVAILLVAKPELEGFSRALTREELSSALEFAVITVIVLPLLPNRGFGPWAVLNPREIWLVVVLVTGFSFAGFIAMRLLGTRLGLVLAGAIGGLVSSTAVTLSLAQRSRADRSLAYPAGAAAILASVVMCIRIAVIAAAVNPHVLPRLSPVLGAMALVGGLAVWRGARSHTAGAAESGRQVRNPFSLPQALVFAVIYSGALLIARGAKEWQGSAGLFPAAALSALADVDAITIAVVRMGPGDTLWRVPAAAVSLAAAVNTMVKMGLALGFGSARFRSYVAIGLGLMAGAGIAVGCWVYLGF
jgi:uncharacterized membrane protein (DUF4010 family)